MKIKENNMPGPALPAQDHKSRLLWESFRNQTKLDNKIVPLKFWESDRIFTCPVVGACLTLSEQKQLLKKAGIPIKRKSRFDIHEILVNSSGREGRLSSKIDGLLNRKFKHEVDAFLPLDEGRFLRLWDERFKDGKIEGVLWVTAIKPDLSSKAKVTVFGDLHMEMHQGSAKIREEKSLRHVKNMEQQRLTTDLNEIKKTVRLLRKQNEMLKKEISDLCRKNELLEKKAGESKVKLSLALENSPLSMLRSQNMGLEADLNKSLHKLMDAQQKIATLEEQNAQLSSDLKKYRGLNDSITIELERNLILNPAGEDCDESCPSFDLCKKRILLVGGIARMEALYRRMIEERGGIFEYHDGHMKGGAKRLENQVRRADMVICPTNYNSHGACLTVKKLGRKHSKPIRMLSNSALNSIFRALHEYQENAGRQCQKHDNTSVGGLG